MLSNPAVGNGSQKFKRKLTNKHVKGHTNTGAGQGTHCPGLKTPKPGNQKHQHRKNSNPGTENTQTWGGELREGKTPRVGTKKTNTEGGKEKHQSRNWKHQDLGTRNTTGTGKTNLGKGNTTGRENTNLGTENTQPGQSIPV